MSDGPEGSVTFSADLPAVESPGKSTTGGDDNGGQAASPKVGAVVRNTCYRYSYLWPSTVAGLLGFMYV